MTDVARNAARADRPEGEKGRKREENNSRKAGKRYPARLTNNAEPARQGRERGDPHLLPLVSCQRVLTAMLCVGRGTLLDTPD